MLVHVTLGLFISIPVSMLLVVFGAICAGMVAAAWFTAESRRARRVHVVTVVIEPEPEPELLEKTS
jgi:hypothetical protein